MVRQRLWFDIISRNRHGDGRKRLASVIVGFRPGEGAETRPSWLSISLKVSSSTAKPLPLHSSPGNDPELLALRNFTQSGIIITITITCMHMYITSVCTEEFELLSISRQPSTRVPAALGLPCPWPALAPLGGGGGHLQAQEAGLPLSHDQLLNHHSHGCTQHGKVNATRGLGEATPKSVLPYSDVDWALVHVSPGFSGRCTAVHVAKHMA